jgi:phage-related protein
MPLDFPTSPTLNQIYTSSGYSWQWNGSAWNVYSSGTSGISGPYVITFNGLTGAVSGVTTGVANNFGPLQNFSSGISVSGATFSNNVQIIGNLIVTGKIITETGIFGVTYNNTIESIDDMSMDGGEF